MNKEKNIYFRKLHYAFYDGFCTHSFRTWSKEDLSERIFEVTLKILEASRRQVSVYIEKKCAKKV